jgi:hypothetical protein
VKAVVCTGLVCSAFAYAASAQRNERKYKVNIKGEIVAYESRVSGEVSFAPDLFTLIVKSSDTKRGPFLILRYTTFDYDLLKKVADGRRQIKIKAVRDKSCDADLETLERRDASEVKYEQIEWLKDDIEKPSLVMPCYTAERDLRFIGTELSPRSEFTVEIVGWDKLNLLVTNDVADADLFVGRIITTQKEKGPEYVFIKQAQFDKSNSIQQIVTRKPLLVAGRVRKDLSCNYDPKNVFEFTSDGELPAELKSRIHWLHDDIDPAELRSLKCYVIKGSEYTLLDESGALVPYESTPL